MSLYTLYVPKNVAYGDPVALEKARVIREGFHLWAYALTGFWLIGRSAWIAGVAVLAAFLAIAVLVARFDLHPAAAAGAQVLLALWVGLEAQSLVRWTWTRNGYAFRDVVTAKSIEEAEAKLFTRWLSKDRVATPEMAVSHAAAVPVIDTRLDTLARPA
jgi:Protein of unknown function (DUF2628)